MLGGMHQLNVIYRGKFNLFLCWCGFLCVFGRLFFLVVVLGVFSMNLKA